MSNDKERHEQPHPTPPKPDRHGEPERKERGNSFPDYHNPPQPPPPPPPPPSKKE